MTERREAYLVYLQSQEWAEVKERVFKSRGKVCVACGSTENINVHHITYKNLGNEKLKDLAVLCFKCHTLVHKLGKGKKALQNLLSPEKRAAREERRNKRNKDRLKRKQFIVRMLSGPVKVYTQEEIDSINKAASHE